MVNLKILEKISLICFIVLVSILLFFYKSFMFYKIIEIEEGKNVIVEGNITFDGISKKGNYKYYICDETGCCLLISKQKVNCKKIKAYVYAYSSNNCILLLKRILECIS